MPAKYPPSNGRRYANDKMRMIYVQGGIRLLSDAAFVGISNEPEFCLRHPRGSLTLLSNSGQKGTFSLAPQLPDVRTVGYEIFADLLSSEPEELMAGLHNVSRNALRPVLRDMGTKTMGLTMVYLIRKRHNNDRYIGYEIPTAVVTTRGFNLEGNPSEDLVRWYSVAFENGQPKGAIFHIETPAQGIIKGSAEDVLDGHRLSTLAEALRGMSGTSMRKIGIDVVAPSISGDGLEGAIIRPAYGIGIRVGRNPTIEQIPTSTIDEVVES